MDYSRPAAGLKFAFSGMDTVHPPDSLAEGKYPVAVNLRAYLADQITPRLPQGSALATTVAAAVHSLRKLTYAAGSWPRGKYALIIGVGSSLFVDSSSVLTGLSGFRLAMVTFRPDASPEPWMYLADYGGPDINGHSVGRQVKVNATGTVYNTGIAEPQDAAVASASIGEPPPAVTNPCFYRYRYRSSVTGAVSNPSPPMRVGFNITTDAPLIVCTASTDPQVDLIDIYRFDGALLDYTYIGTRPNGGVSLFRDQVDDAVAANNPLLEFDNFEPFPSIDLPKSGILTVTSANVLTYASGDVFLPTWLPGNLLILVNGPTVTLYNRPVHPTMEVLEDLTAFIGANFKWNIAAPTFANQILPAWWGPTDNAGYFFACGDPLREGTLYFTKGNNPDSAPDTNQIEVTSPSEPLIGGCIVGGLAMVFSSERAWLIYPNFSQAVATVVGVVGSPFNLVESISERGLYCHQGICTDGGGWVYFITKDGIRKSPAGSGSQSITDNDLYNLFPHEGIPQQAYTVTSSGGVLFTLSPPDYTNREGMVLRFAQGYVYFDYVGLDADRHSLVYDTIHDAWSVDIYGTSVSVHADNEASYVGIPSLTPTALESGIGTLMGCADGTVRRLDPAGTETATMTLFTPSYNNGDRRSTKRFGEIYLEASCPAGASRFTVAAYADRYVTAIGGGLSPTIFPSVLNGLRRGDIGEFGGGAGVYFKDMGFVITLAVGRQGAKLFTWQPALIPQPETTQLRNTDWDDAGSPGAKLVQGIIIEADSLNIAKSFTAQSGDDDSIHAFAEMGAGVVFNGQSMKALSFAVPFVAHSFRIVPDSTPWNLFKVQWIFVPYPELVREWHTEGTSHGLPSWQHVKELNIAHISTADLTLTLTRDFGTPIVVTVPNSGGIQTKTLVQIPPPSKFKIVSYNVTSTEPFRLWVEDLECWVCDWESDGGYKRVKPFGGPSALQAVI